MSSEGQLKGEEVTVDEGLGIAFFINFFLHEKEQLSEEPMKRV